jgi:hypothetical protein
MALSTKLSLTNAKVEQVSGGTLNLSGDTIIYPNTGELRYAVHPSSFTPTSVVDAIYVTGQTANAATAACAYAHAQDVIVSGATLSAANNYTNACATCLTNKINYVSGCTAANTADIVALGAVSGITLQSITGVTNGLTKVGSHSAKLGGTLTETTTLVGSQILNINVNKLNLTGATSGVTLSGNGLYIPATLAGSGDLLCINSSTKQVGLTSLSAFGGITGGTNGICNFPNQKLGLGGVLTQDTIICGNNSKSLYLGTTGSKLNLFEVQTSGDTNIISNGNLVMILSGGTITTNDNKGLKYNTDYSTTFENNSLVSKLYVDSVAAGLDPKSAVVVATTTGQNLDLTGAETIDGVVTTTGMRVLVKNQTDATQNGIYVANSSGAWTRATDFDGTPSGEVTQGALIPVLSGNTNINSSWILVTPDPITIGSTALLFTKFSQLLDIAEGVGIGISTVGQTKNICVKLGSGSATGCGLAVSSNGLCVDSNIAGNGLSYASGVLNVNAASGGSASSVAVKYNAGDCLVINTADINTALGGVISGVTNGLTEYTTGVVGLGGTLTQATTITGNDACSLTFNDTASTNKRGILYGGDYSSSYVARSLVDAGYVTGLTSGLNSRLNVIEPIYITGGTEGIYKYDAHNVCLGGTMINGSTIFMCNAALLRFQGCNNIGTLLNLGNPNVSIQYQGVYLGYIITDSPQCGSEIRFCNGIATIFSQSGSTAKIVSLDYSKALEYSDDYSSDYTNRSLVDKEYVDTLVATSGVTASNGLHTVGNDVRLGGNLSGNTTINTDDGNLSITGGTVFGLFVSPTCGYLGNNESQNAVVYVCGDSTNSKGVVCVRPNNVNISVDNSSGSILNFNFTGTEAIIGSSSESFAGMMTIILITILYVHLLMLVM